MSYKDYLQSEHWKKYRFKVLEFWNNKCGMCMDEAKDVHHRHYNSVGNEELMDCISLCRSCHIRQSRSLREIAQTALDKVQLELNAARLRRNDSQGVGDHDQNVLDHQEVGRLEDLREILIKAGAKLKDIRPQWSVDHHKKVAAEIAVLVAEGWTTENLYCGVPFIGKDK